MSTKTIIELGILFLVVGGAIGQYVIQKYDQKVSSKKNEKMSLEINVLNKDVDTLTQVIDDKDKIITSLEKKLNVINSLNIFVKIKIKTQPSEITPKQTSTGLQNILGLFTNDSTRYRFATNFQFSTEQKKSDTKYIYFEYLPEDPKVLYSKSIELLENFSTIGFDFKNIFKRLKIISSNSVYEISLSLVLNGVEIVNSDKFVVTHEQINSGTFSYEIPQLFKGVNEKYTENFR
jgi:hypothetical protein